MPKYACHNRGEFAPSVTVQDGWLNTWARRMVDMEFRLDPNCIYSTSELGKKDEQCHGCRWKASAGTGVATGPVPVGDSLAGEEMTLGERLREIYSFSEETGIFLRIGGRRPPKKSIGRPAGSRAANGYIYLYVDGKKYLAHRLAWYWVKGQWPENDIDHINGDRTDNRIANLRDVLHQINTQNWRRPKPNNASGFLGVSRVRKNGKWLACIKLNGRSTSLGYFDTPEGAHEAYLKAKRANHPGNTL